ncbi:MAG: 2TM domain-containing protein [Sneathiella sp.]
MTLRERRLQKAWSQEYLAQASGLSVRTIQRIEGGQKAGLDTLNCLAAAFDIDVADLMEENTMALHTANQQVPEEERERRSREQAEYIQNIRGFHLNWIMFVVIVPALFAFNYFLTPEQYWVQWVFGSWGAAILLHAIILYFYYGVFGRDWENRTLEKMKE